MLYKHPLTKVFLT